MKSIVRAFAALAILASAAAAQAATIEYDFRGDGGNLGLAEVFEQDGLATTATFALFGIAKDGTQTPSGLGVATFDGGVNLAESVTFRFSRDVRFQNITLAEAPNRFGKAPISIFVDGQAHTSSLISGSAAQTVELFNVIGSELTVLRTGLLSFANVVRIQGLEVVAMPIPGAVWLFGSALAAAGAGRRFRKSA
jgi:hypothetical protein